MKRTISTTLTCKDSIKAITILKYLYLENNRILYPSVPDHARAAPNYTDKTANGLTRCIIDYINLTGGHAERINCTGRIIDNRTTSTDVLGHQRIIGSTTYVKTSGQRGTADISATIRGRSVKIEVKIGRDKQSEAQKQYQKSIEESGGVYYIAKDFNQFYYWHYDNFEGATYGRTK